MNTERNSQHTIDMIFPLTLLFVFAVSAFAVLILSARTYAVQTSRSESLYAVGTPVAYIREKLRQNDTSDKISVGELDGENSLILQDSSSGYVTYIYEYQGMLKELTVRDGITVHARDGQDVIPLSEFYAEEISDGLFYISCQSEEQDPQSIVFSERSAH